MRIHPITPAQFIRQHILGMSKKEFADALGVHESIVSRYEARGTIPERHVDKVCNIAKKRKLRIEFSWFSKVPFLPGVPA